MADKKSHSKRRYKNYKSSSVTIGDNARKTMEDLNEDNETIKLFKKYSKEIDDKHDRYERIFKLNRDITIESKRIISLLHNTDTDNKQQDNVPHQTILTEAEIRLKNLFDTSFKKIAIELDGYDSYLYLKAYTNGLQEFIEAWCFYNYIVSGNIPRYDEIRPKFEYESKNQEENDVAKKIILVFPYGEYILGLGDFTGELMRRCINNLGGGKIDDCFKICNYVKDMLIGFLSVNTIGYKEVGRKLYVLKQSLAKMELVCYNIKVRGSEVPKHMLAHVINPSDDNNVATDEDEGFY